MEEKYEEKLNNLANEAIKDNELELGAALFCIIGCFKAGGIVQEALRQALIEVAEFGIVIHTEKKDNIEFSDN